MVSNGVLPDFFWISQDTNVGFCCLLPKIRIYYMHFIIWSFFISFLSFNTNISFKYWWVIKNCLPLLVKDQLSPIFAIIKTPICYIFLLIIAIGISAPFTWPPWDLYKEAWFLMGFYLILHALASNVQVSDNWSSTRIIGTLPSRFSDNFTKGPWYEHAHENYLYFHPR
jgi:hypothetical protein